MAELASDRTDVTFTVIHRLALRSRPSPLPADLHTEHRWLIDDGLAREVAGGFELTGQGYRLHRALLDAERASLDLAALGLNDEAVRALGGRLAQIRRDWTGTPNPSPELLASLLEFASMAAVLLDQTAAVVSRLDVHEPALHHAIERVRGGDHRFAVDPGVESVAVIWNDIHEDYLQTLGRGYDMEAV